MNQSGPNNLNLGPLWSDGRANTNYDARAIQMLGPIQPETAAADLIFSTLSLSRGGSGAWVQLIWIKFLHICPISTQLRNMSIKFIAILDHTSMLTLVYSTKYSLISPLLTLGQRPDMHYAIWSLASERVWKLIRRAGSLVNDALDPVTHVTIKLWVALFTQKVYDAVSFYPLIIWWDQNDIAESISIYSIVFESEGTQGIQGWGQRRMREHKNESI